MDLLRWITIGFIIIGFVVLASMKRNIESKKSSTKSIVWWRVGTVAWGIVSIILIMWWFSAK